MSSELFYDKKPGFDKADKAAVMAYAEGYKDVRPGDKLYQINRDKGVILAHIGRTSLAEGVHLTAAHLDAPRIDIRTVPLYEQEGMAFFKTHYYGGIK